MVRNDVGLEGDPEQRQRQRCPLRLCRLEGNVESGAGGEEKLLAKALNPLSV